MTNFHNSTSDSSLEEETQDSSVSSLPARPPYQADEMEEEVNQDESLSSDSDDCIIIGFIKPFAERSPELVKLSSDSDVSAEEDMKEESPLPQNSLSPTASQSTEPGSADRWKISGKGNLPNLGHSRTATLNPPKRTLTKTSQVERENTRQSIWKLH